MTPEEQERHEALNVPSSVIDLVAQQQFEDAIGQGDKLKSHLEHLIGIYNKNGGVKGLAKAE